MLHEKNKIAILLHGSAIRTQPESGDANIKE
jgi:hypothetical protein